MADDPTKTGAGDDPTKTPPAKTTRGMDLRVLRGTFVAGGKSYGPGQVFTVSKKDGNYLLKNSNDVEKA